MSEREHRTQSKVYDEFRTYVHQNMRKKNRNATVVGFDELQNSGPTHLKIGLLNIEVADKHMFDIVAKFAPGTSLKIDEDISTGAPSYHAYVPWNKTKKVSFNDDEDDEVVTTTSVVTPLLWSMAMFATITAASLTTSLTQWKLLYGL